MKTKVLSLFALLALLAVSTAALSDGRPSGLRIGRAVSGGGTNVEVDVTVLGTNRFYYTSPSTVWLDNDIYNVFSAIDAWQYASPAHSYNYPVAVSWGDGSAIVEAPLFGNGGAPYRATFEHTYLVPGTYVVTAADVHCCQTTGSAVASTGNLITSSVRYVWDGTLGNQTFTANGPYGSIVAITANATVTTGTGIPAMNVYGLLAMALVLVGAGLLVVRRPQHNAF